MSRQYGAIPLHINFEAGEVRAITQHNDLLVIGFEGGIIKTIPLTFDEKGGIVLGQHESIRLKVDNYEIYDLKAFGENLLVHIKAKDGSPGPLLTITQRGKFNRIQEWTSTFSPNSFTQSKTIAVIYEKRLMVKEWNGTEFKQIFNREYADAALTVALTYPKVCMISHQKIIIVDIITGTSLDLKTFGMTKPLVLSRDSASYFAYTYLSSMVFDLNLSADMAPMTFDTPPIDHARCGHYFASMAANQIWIYDFQHHKGHIPLQACKRICGFNSSFLVATSKDVYCLKDMSEAYEHLIVGSIEAAISTLMNQSPESLSALFEMLWNNDKKLQAFSLFKTKSFEPIIPSVLRLFPFLVFDAPPKNPGLLQCCSPFQKKETVILFVEFLVSTRDIPFSDSTKQLIDTSIVEIYGYLDEFDLTMDFLESKNMIDHASIDLFFDSVNGLSKAAYLCSQNKINEAIEIIKKLDKSFSAARRILIQNATNWSLVEQHIHWLLRNCPTEGIKVLTSQLIDIIKSKMLILKDYPVMYPRFLLGALHNREVITVKPLVNEIVLILIRFLLEIRSPKFQISELSFLNCMIENPKSSIDTAEKELSDELLGVLRAFRKDIATNDLMACVSKIPVTRVRIEIYSAAGCFEEALKILWSESNTKINDCEAYCQSCEDPPKGFSFLYRMMKGHMAKNDYIKALTAMLSRNLTIIDIGDAFSTIDDDESIESVIGDIIDVYHKVTNERASAQIECALAESLTFEREYEKTRLISGHMKITSDSLCSGCGKALGYQYICHTPSGKYYHNKCYQAKK